MPHPAFAHAPMPNRIQAILYGGGQPLEYFYAARKTDKAAIAKVNNEAQWAFRHSFIVRDDAGRVIYDDPVLGALGKPMGAPELERAA